MESAGDAGVGNASKCSLVGFFDVSYFDLYRVVSFAIICLLNHFLISVAVGFVCG